MGFFFLRSSISKLEPFQTDLMYYVPETVNGITACSDSSQKLDAYWSSPTMKELKALLVDKDRVVSMIAPLVSAEKKSEVVLVVEKTVRVIKAVLESKIVQFSLKFDKYVQYQSIDPKFPIPVSVALVELTESMDLKSDYDLLKSAGIPVSEESLDGITFYTFDYNAIIQSLTVTMAQQDSPFPGMKMYFATSGKKMGIGTDKDSIRRFFKGEKYEKLPALLSDPALKDAFKNLDYDKSIDFCQSYMDFKAMMLASMNAGSASAGTNLQTPEMQKMLDNFPVLGVAQTVGFDKSLRFTQQWAVKETSIPEEAKVWVEALTTTGKYEGLGVFPSDTVMATSLNGEVLKKLKETAEKTPSVASQISQIPYLDLATSIKTFSFAVTPPSTGMIWPEGLITVKLDKAKELATLAKEQISNNMAGSGLPNFKWLEKNVAGANVNYFNTPFGVGLYLAEAGSYFVAAASEAGLTNFLNVKDSGKGSLEEKFKSAGILRYETSLAETYLNIPALLQLARTIQTSLAMFMPVNVQVSKDFDVIARAIGEYYVGVGLNPGYFTVKVHQRPL